MTAESLVSTAGRKTTVADSSGSVSRAVVERPSPISVVWRPPLLGPVPVVLLGHGGSGHKLSERHVRLAERFTAAGIACLSVDGPFHGGRAVPGDGPVDYQQRVIAEGAHRVHQRMTADWLAALDTAVSAGWVDGQNVGFLGMSMGSRYGIPVCAALSPRLRCAVIGKFGLTQTALLPQGLAGFDLIVAAAQTLSAPVLQHIQLEDEVFPRAGQMDLFELYPSDSKQVREQRGGHADDRPADETAWCEFLAHHLHQQGHH